MTISPLGLANSVELGWNRCISRLLGREIHEGACFDLGSPTLARKESRRNAQPREVEMRSNAQIAQ